MVAQGWGRVINLSSWAYKSGGLTAGTAYSASKAAMVGMSKSMAKELGAKGVTVNVVAPGFIKTDMTDAMGEEIIKEIAPRIPVRRLGEPGEIAHAVSWLAGERAGYVTGQVLVVDGGLAM